MQLTKFSKLKIFHTPGKNLSVADMLSRSSTKAELQLNQLKHKQLPPPIDFALLRNGTLKPVHYLIKHEEILPHQKHEFHSIFADYGTDHSLFVSMTEEMTLLSNFYNPSHSNL